MREAVTEAENSKLIESVESLRKNLSKLENIVLYLYNFDTKTLAEVLDTIDYNRKGEEHLGKIRGNFVWPILDIVETDEYITVVGLELIFAKNKVVDVVKKNEKLALRLGRFLYPLKPITFEASIMLLLNKDSSFYRKVENVIGEPYLPKLISKSILTANSFFKKLKATYEEKFIDVTFAIGYKSYVGFVVDEENTDFVVESYDLSEGVWVYYGLKGLYVNNVNRIKTLIEYAGVNEENFMYALLKTEEILRNISLILSASYILTKSFNNLL